MPLGLMNVPLTIHRMMDTIVRGLPFVRVYFDDDIVFPKNVEAHLIHLQKVFDVINEAGLRLKLSK